MTRTQTLILVATTTLLVAGCNAAAPPESIERATVNGDWQLVEKAAADWVNTGGFTRSATILRGYAALARGEVANAAAHFLRGRMLSSPRADLSWAKGLSARHP